MAMPSKRTIVSPEIVVPKPSQARSPPPQAPAEIVVPKPRPSKAFPPKAVPIAPSKAVIKKLIKPSQWLRRRYLERKAKEASVREAFFDTCAREQEQTKASAPGS